MKKIYEVIGQFKFLLYIIVYILKYSKIKIAKLFNEIVEIFHNPREIFWETHQTDYNIT